MTILDEDIPEDQYQLLRRWRLPARRIGVEVGRLGMKDREIISLLHSLNRPTFFSLDHGFFKRELCHQAYCLVHLNVEEQKAAEFIRRMLRHHQLNSWRKRKGSVLRLRPRGISLWRAHAGQLLQRVMTLARRLVPANWLWEEPDGPGRIESCNAPVRRDCTPEQPLT